MFVPSLPEVAGAKPESDEESEGAFSAPESLSTFELSAELEVFEPFPLIFVPSLPEVAGAIPEPLFEEVFELVDPFELDDDPLLEVFELEVPLLVELDEFAELEFELEELLLLELELPLVFEPLAGTTGTSNVATPLTTLVLPGLNEGAT